VASVVPPLREGPRGVGSTAVRGAGGQPALQERGGQIGRMISFGPQKLRILLKFRAERLAEETRLTLL